MVIPDPRPTMEDPDDDPYLHLEDSKDPKTIAWIKEQNRRTIDSLDAEKLGHDTKILTEIYDREGMIPGIDKQGDTVYEVHYDEHHPRGVLRSMSWKDYIDGSKKWETNFDMTMLPVEDGEQWNYRFFWSLPPDHEHAMVYLDHGGSRAVAMREYNLKEKRFVPQSEGGYELGVAKGHAEWVDKDTLVISSAHGGPEFETKSSYNSTVRLWRRGTPFTHAEILFKVPKDHVSADVIVDHTATNGSKRLIFYDKERLTSLGASDKIYVTGVEPVTDQTAPLEVPRSNVEIQGNLLVVKPEEKWSVGGETFPPDTVLSFKLDSFLAGDCHPSVVWKPQPNMGLRDVNIVSSSIVLNYKDNLESVIGIMTQSKDGVDWEEKRLPGLAKIGTAYAYAPDGSVQHVDDTIAVLTQGPLSPTKRFLSSTKDTQLKLLHEESDAFDPTGLEEHMYSTKFGEITVPYLVVGPTEGSQGNAAVYLTGYGCHGADKDPLYLPGIGKLCLEQGGTYVSAFLPGGGEKGEAWRVLGQRENKHISHSCFHAVGQDLVKRNITKPNRITVSGDSSAGLLAGKLFTDHGDSYGSFCMKYPTLDLKRSPHLGSGASWISEFGDPDSKDWDNFMTKLSVYHQAPGGPGGPTILIMVTATDDHVHPGHGRKVAAKWQAHGKKCLLYEDPEGGHGSTTNRSAAHSWALSLQVQSQAIGGWGSDSPKAE